MNNQRGMAVIFLTALIVCVIMLAVLQFAFEMDTYVGYFLAVGAGAVAISYVCIKYMDSDRELQRVEKTINKLIQLQNKVKIRYVNNCQLMEYLYLKYNTDSAARLEKLWKMYQDEKEERKQFAEAEAKIEYYQKQLVEQLSNYRVQMPERWIGQTAALLDKREMVEIRHELIQRRQALRKQMDYNQEVAETARNEVKDVAAAYPRYAKEILSMVERYDRYRIDKTLPVCYYDTVLAIYHAKVYNAANSEWQNGRMYYEKSISGIIGDQHGSRCSYRLWF